MIGIGLVWFGRVKQRWGWVQFGLVGFSFVFGWIVLVSFTGVFPENLNDLGIFFIQG